MGDFVKFIGKYADELRASVGIFGLILRALPIDPSDKRRAVETLDNLERAADRIEASLSHVMADGVINRDDLKTVLREILPEILPDMIGGMAERGARAAAPKPARVRPSRAKKAADAAT
jgi:hypothetical protein